MFRVIGVLKSIKRIQIHVRVIDEPFQTNRFRHKALNVVNFFSSSSPACSNAVENGKYGAFKNPPNVRGEPHTLSRNASSSTPGQAYKRINVYCEHPENKLHEFRAAELRLENKIVVSRPFAENDPRGIHFRIPNPVMVTTKAFHHKGKFLTMVCKNKLFKPSPMQSQAWPIIMSGQDFIGVGGSEEDRRLSVLLPSLLHVEQQRELRGQKELTVLWLSASHESALLVEKDMKKFSYNGIECVCVGDGSGDQISALDSLESKKIEVVIATPVQLRKIIQNGKVKLDSVSYVVLEIADDILNDGVESEIKSILSGLRKESTDSQILVTCNNFCTGLEHLMSSYLFDPVMVKVGFLDLAATKGVVQRCRYEGENTKFNKAIAYLSSLASEDKVVVFCSDELTITKLLVELSVQNIECEELLPDTENNDREKILAKLKDGTAQVLITNVPARNLDMTAFTHRYIYDFPKTIDEYIALISRKCDVGPGITTISILSENDWAMVPDLITVLRKTNQAVEPKLFELANRFEPVMFRDDATFPQLAQTEVYVDKSDIIAKIVEQKDQFLFTAARKMGKTAILRMLDCFFNIQGDEKKVKPLFEKLKIGQRPDIIEQHLCKYPIINVDMSKFGTLNIDSVESCIKAMREIVREAYLDHVYLSDDIVKEWTDEKLYRNLPEERIFRGLLDLAGRLLKYHKKEVILLCDEFDSICEAALSKNVSSDTLDEIIRTYFKLFTDLVKTGDAMAVEGKPAECESYLFRAAFFGVTAVTCSGASPLNTLQADKFLESGRFSQYFGITRSEFEELLDKPRFENLRDEKEHALARYNGYTCSNGEQLLCTYSIVCYLRNYSEADRLQNYWKNSGSITRYTKLFGRDDMQEYLRPIVNGSPVMVERFDTITAVDLVKISGGTSVKTFKPTNASILLVYLQQLGYFNIEKFLENGFMVLRIPNKEIRGVFSQVLVISLLSKLNLVATQLDACIRSINDLIDENKTEVALENLRNSLLPLCKSRPLIDGKLGMNERTLENIVYVALIYSKFNPLSQRKVEKPDVPFKNWKIFDACFYFENFGVLFEYKYGVAWNAKKAHDEIFKKEYNRIFDKDNKQLGVEFHRKLFVGMHVSEVGEVTFYHTKQPKNISNDAN